MKTETPLCPVHAALEAHDGLVLEVGNDCVACSLNERSELLNLLEPFAPDDHSEDSVTVLRKLTTGWQPIETAPTDGRSFLVASVAFGHVDRAFYLDKELVIVGGRYQATLWMPLPELPKAATPPQ